MKIRCSRFLLCIIMYGLFITQLYSYKGAEYKVIFEGSHAYQQLAISNTITVGMHVIIFLCLIGLFLYECRRLTGVFTKTYLLILLTLVAGIVCWTIDTAWEIGFVEMLYSTTSPLVYLTILGICIGMDEELFSYFLIQANRLGLVSLAFSLVSYIGFLQKHDAMTLGNSSVLVYYVQGFWLLCIVSLLGKQKPSLVYLEIGVAGFLALLFNSRSWIIQTVIWLLAYAYCSSQRKGLIKAIKFLFLGVVGVLLVYYIAESTYPEIVDYFIEKIMKDSRSGQYRDLFRQTNFWDFVVGQGHSFQYYSSEMGRYSYIDNAYLFMLIRYGLIIGLTYPLMFIYPVVKQTLSPRRSVAVMPVVMWMLALGGLSVYCATILDIKSIVLAAVAGRCLFLSKQKEVKDVV